MDFASQDAKWAVGRSAWRLRTRIGSPMIKRNDRHALVGPETSVRGGCVASGRGRGDSDATTDHVSTVRCRTPAGAHRRARCLPQLDPGRGVGRMDHTRQGAPGDRQPFPPTDARGRPMHQLWSWSLRALTFAASDVSKTVLHDSIGAPPVDGRYLWCPPIRGNHDDFANHPFTSTTRSVGTDE
jgi:hypothetical protein